MKAKVSTLEAVLEHIHDGQTILFGDMHGEMSAEEIITGMLEKGVKDLHIIAVSAGAPDLGLGRLIKEHRVSSMVTTHIGMNPYACDQMLSGELKVEFVPMGSFIERIRCGGSGLGGCLTKVGLGTPMEEGKQKISIDGEEWLLEKPLHADVALIKATTADRAGNLAFRLVSRAFNSDMAYSADYVIAEVEDLVEIGELGPQEIDIPAPIVDSVYVRTGTKKIFYPLWQRAKAKAEAKAAAKGGK